MVIRPTPTSSGFTTTTTMHSNGDMGFPYFLICYHGEAGHVMMVGGQGGGDGNCDGYGETWGN